jgi:hypothetical protein
MDCDLGLVSGDWRVERALIGSNKLKLESG